jgi:hypothetical protein
MLSFPTFLTGGISGGAAPVLDYSKVGTFGDSINEFEFNTGDNAIARATGLIIRNPGGGEIGSALARDPRATFEVYNDVTNTSPTFNGNVAKYYSGMDVSFAGATVSELLTQAATAAAYFRTRGIGTIVLGGGTNSLPWDAAVQTAHLAIIDAFLAANPLFKIYVGNIRPIAVSRVDASRSPANIAAGNVLLAANVTARTAQGVQLLDLNAAMGGGGTAADKYFLGDGLHLSALGGFLGSVPVLTAIQASTGSTNVLTARRIASLMTANLDNMNGSDTVINVAAGGAGNTGTITGFVPAPVVFAKAGNVNSNVVCSTSANAGTGGRKAKASITTVSGNSSEQLAFRPVAINSLLTTAWANTWADMYAIVTVTDASGILTTATLNTLERSNTANDLTQRVIGIAKESLGTTRTYYILCPPKKGTSTSTGHQMALAFAFDPSIAGTADIEVEYWTAQSRAAPVGAA